MRLIITSMVPALFAMASIASRLLEPPASLFIVSEQDAELEFQGVEGFGSDAVFARGGEVFGVAGVRQPHELGSSGNGRCPRAVYGWEGNRAFLRRRPFRSRARPAKVPRPSAQSGF